MSELNAFCFELTVDDIGAPLGIGALSAASTLQSAERKRNIDLNDPTTNLLIPT